MSPKARAALDAICDTFAPGGDGLPSATELGVPDALLALVGRNPRAAERRQVGQLLGVWDSRLLCAIAGGRSARPRIRRRPGSSRSPWTGTRRSTATWWWSARERAAAPPPPCSPGRAS